MLDPVSCSSDEQQPLGHEVSDEDKVVSVWDRPYKFVPCENEVREYEKNCSECEKTAALKHRAHKHAADQEGVDAYSDAHDSMWNLRNYPAVYEHEKSQCAESYHGDIAFGLACQLAVLFHLLEVSVDEIDDEPYMSESEESHLSHEIVA